jgi:hypothetical protein
MPNRAYHTFLAFKKNAAKTPFRAILGGKYASSPEEQEIRQMNLLASKTAYPFWKSPRQKQIKLH